MCKGRRILVGDGKPLADLIQEYNDLCKEKNISMFEALDSAVHIQQLRDPKFRSNILTKMSMIRGYIKRMKYYLFFNLLKSSLELESNWIDQNS